MKIKKLLKKIKRPIIIFFSLGLIGFVMDEYVFPFLVNKRLIDTLKKIDPIYVLILCIANVIFSVFLFTKIRKLSKLSRSEMNIGFSKVNEEELKSLKSEHKSILEHLIQQHKYLEYRGNLWEFFQEQYPDKSELEFSISLKEMQRLGYITQHPFSGGLIVKITDRACEKLGEKIKDKIYKREIKK